MNEKFELKKLGADKLAFLGLFIISLLVAQLMVYAKSAVVFSDPIELPHTGLSISIPNGRGWVGTNEWRFRNGAFELFSNFKAGRTLPLATVTCQYLATSQDINPEAWLRNQSDEPNDVAIESGTMKKGSLTVRWAHKVRRVNTFLGTVELPHNRVVIIEVVENSLAIDMAEKVFKKIIEKLEFKEENSIKTGMEIVNEMKSKGLETFINSRNQEAYFLIRDSLNNNLGFTVDMLGKASKDISDAGRRIRGASQLFFTGANRQEQNSFFSSDKDLSAYAWQSKSLSRTDVTTTKIVRDETGTIKVSALINNTSGENTYANRPDVIPTMLLELILDRIIENDIDEVVLDMIDSSGNLKPALFSVEHGTRNDEGDEKVIRLEFINGTGAFELLYLNDENQLVKEVIHRDGTYILERTTFESVQQEFPRQAGDILRREQLFEDNLFQ